MPSNPQSSASAFSPSSSPTPAAAAAPAPAAAPARTPPSPPSPRHAADIETCTDPDHGMGGKHGPVPGSDRQRCRRRQAAFFVFESKPGARHRSRILLHPCSILLLCGRPIATPKHGRLCRASALRGRRHPAECWPETEGRIRPAAARHLDRNETAHRLVLCCRDSTPELDRVRGRSSNIPAGQLHRARARETRRSAHAWWRDAQLSLARRPHYRHAKGRHYNGGAQSGFAPGHPHGCGRNPLL